jgi:hypothetical protein
MPERCGKRARSRSADSHLHQQSRQLLTRPDLMLDVLVSDLDHHQRLTPQMRRTSSLGSGMPLAGPVARLRQIEVALSFDRLSLALDLFWRLRLALEQVEEASEIRHEGLIVPRNLRHIRGQGA